MKFKANDPRQQMNDKPVGEKYMTLCGALMTMLGKKDLVLKVDDLPARPFVIAMRNGAEPGTIELRFRYDDEGFEPLN